MVLFLLLAIILILMVVITLAIISVTGAVGIIVFSDVIVCIAILVWIMKKLIKNKK